MQAVGVDEWLLLSLEIGVNLITNNSSSIELFIGRKPCEMGLRAELTVVGGRVFFNANQYSFRTVKAEGEPKS
jgi:hypothetical protein